MSYKLPKRLSKANKKALKAIFQAQELCANERPNRKTICQLPDGHEGSHRAVIYWE